MRAGENSEKLVGFFKKVNPMAPIKKVLFDFL